MTENKKNINRLPVLTPEQRAANLARAVEARRERAAAKLEIAEGRRDAAAEVLEPGEVLAGERVYPFLTACPKVGPASARRIIRELGLSENRRLKGLGARQRQRLACALAALAGGDNLTQALEAARGM